MSTKEVDAPARPAPSSVRPGLRAFADRWPFQRKLTLLVGVPLTVIAVLLAYLITDLVQDSDRAEEAAQLARDSAEVARLVSLIEAEHQQAILLSVRHQAAFDGGTPSSDPYRVAQITVDSQIRTVRETFGDRLPAGEARALKEIEGLAGLRDTVEQGYLPADNIDPAYSGAAQSLIDGLGLDRNSALATTFTGSLLDSLLRADAAHGAYETGVFSALTGDSNALIEYTGAVGSHKLYMYQADRFARFATEAQAERLGGIEHNAAQAVIGRHFAELAVDPSALQAESTDEIRVALRNALGAYGDYQQQAETRLEITGALIDQIADRAEGAATSAQWRVGLLLNLTLLGFAVWIGFSVLVRRSVIRPVLALTAAAQEVADVAGRELARVADDDAEESGPPRLRELPVTADDEIGELARVFNNVQTKAAALLERQVLSRRNVAEMFGNVGRRVSNLTSRQLSLIDAVERGETDPALLERLYSIDHIAVRLRRNADSLMLLAGIRETVLDAGPTALTNVVRAALGQIEDYRRVRLHARTEVMVEPDMIGDLTLMVAELLENAVSFSPAGSPVEVTVSAGAEGASVVVADHGLGMSAERLAEENARLVRRERLDLVPTKVLGLFVVGALARRWEVGVALSRTPGGGVTAEVAIPASLLPSPDGMAAATRPAVTAPGATGHPAAAGDSALAGNPAPGGNLASVAEHTGPAPALASAENTAAADLPQSAGASASAGGPEVAASPAPAEAARSAENPVPVTGPTPSVPTVGGEAGGLPRRTPRREAGTDPVETPHVPRARGEEAPTGGTTEEAPAGGTTGARPLRRRVRGATLRATFDAGTPQHDRHAPRPADADMVRTTLEEFEAAVERAHRDTAEIPVDRLRRQDAGRQGTAPGTGGTPRAGDAPPTGDTARTGDAPGTGEAPGTGDAPRTTDHTGTGTGTDHAIAPPPDHPPLAHPPLDADAPGPDTAHTRADAPPAPGETASGETARPDDTPRTPGAAARPEGAAGGSGRDGATQDQNHHPEGAEQ
ncbi:ATP-binding protein [Streptomyces sp. bgisy154]|uniref:ATP-binding protein n=1 Tax=Streptomyces sp. bgisy154 TaxID=3413794 RepID=UPI003D74D962